MEAFVYCWTDNKTNKLYIGSHKGSIDDGYICSSKYMLHEYNKRPHDFTRQIVAEGSLADIRKLEAKILQTVNARLNEQFYNKHENDGFYFDGWKKGEFTEEHKRKMSESAKKRKRSSEHIAALHNGRRNSKNSIEHKEAVSKAKLGSKHSDEAKQKISESRKKHPKKKAFASKAGKASVASRPENYKEIQSARIKLWWAERKKKIGG